MADVHKPLLDERQERVPYGAGFDPLELVQFGNRWESVTGSERRRPDRCPQLSAACCHAGRGSAGSGLRSGMLRCSVNGLLIIIPFVFLQLRPEATKGDAS